MPPLPMKEYTLNSTSPQIADKTQHGRQCLHAGQPAGTHGCQIFAAIGGIPEDDLGWIDLGLCPRSPFRHHVEIITPTTYVYRARYIGINLKYGTFSAPVSCTVSV